MGRVVEVIARDGDQLPDNPHTLAGALAVVRWAAPSLTEEEAIAVRDFLVRRHDDVSRRSFVCAIREVLGEDVEVRDV